MLDEDYSARKLHYWKGTNLLSLDDEAIDVIVERARQPSPLSTTDIWYLGGAIRRVDEWATAYSGRHIPYSVNSEANWRDPSDDAANLAWVRGMNAALSGFSDGSRYLNFGGFHEEGEQVMRATFGKKLERLARIKARYDPVASSA